MKITLFDIIQDVIVLSLVTAMILVVLTSCAVVQAVATAPVLVYDASKTCNP